jgi:hypothetical protein
MAITSIVGRDTICPRYSIFERLDHTLLVHDRNELLRCLSDRPHEQRVDVDFGESIATLITSCLVRTTEARRHVLRLLGGDSIWPSTHRHLRAPAEYLQRGVRMAQPTAVAHITGARRPRPDGFTNFRSRPRTAACSLSSSSTVP